MRWSGSLAEVPLCKALDWAQTVLLSRFTIFVQVSLELNEPVTMAFASRYIGLISKATPLSASVSVSIKNDEPLLVEYKIGDIGHLRYFLAPKTDQGDGEE